MIEQKLQNLATPEVSRHIDVGAQRLLFLLDGDARMQGTALARRSGLSFRQVRYRLDSLSEAGTIRQAHAVVNLGRCGVLESRILVKVAPGSTVVDMTAYLKAASGVVWLGIVAGSFDLVFTVHALDMYELGRVLHEFRKRFDPQIHTISVNSVLWSQYVPRGYLGGGLKQHHRSDRLVSVVSNAPPVALDAVDKSILSRLVADARVSLKEIAAHLALDHERASRETIARREARLRELGVVSGYTFLLDHGSIGVSQYRVLLVVTAEADSDVMAFCVRHSQISKVMKLLGGWDFELNIDVPQGGSPTGVIAQLERVCGHAIREVGAFAVKERLALGECYHRSVLDPSV